MITLENDAVVVRDTGRYGLGLFAKRQIRRGDEIAVFDGPFYEAEKASDLPNSPPDLIRDRAIQVGDTTWRDSLSIARYACHSCEPNCGIDGLYRVVALRTVNKHEECCFDYDMTEDSDWQMHCLCGTPSCRHEILGFRFLPESLKRHYGAYVSNWLKAKYHLESASSPDRSAL